MEIILYENPFLSLKPRETNSYRQVCESLGIAYNPEQVKSTIQRIAEELNLEGKLERILIDGEHAESGVELIGGRKGKTCVYHLNPLLANENEVRHELMHIRDILNPEFEFDSVLEDQISADAALVELVNEVWNVNIDARLRGRGISKEERFSIFSEMLGSLYNICRSEIERIFEELNKAEMVSYKKLVEIAIKLRAIPLI